MNSSTIIFATISFATGATVGFLAGWKWMEKKAQEFNEVRDNKEEKTKEIKETKEAKSINPSKPQIVSNGPAKIATPESKGVDYSAYAKKVEELNYAKAETEHPKDSDEDEVIDDSEEQVPEEEEDYDQRIQRETDEINQTYQKYLKDHENAIEVLGGQPIDKEYPDISFDQETLYYFTFDDLLVDENGVAIDEVDIIGPKLRDGKWYTNSNYRDTWIRNHKYQTDYHVIKEDTSYEDFFGKPYSEEGEEDAE